jgi:phosphoserine aminotransferase
VTDVVKQLKLQDARVLKAEYGALPDLGEVDFSRDVVFTWNGTTSGVRVPNADWIPASRQGLTICDATSAAFAQALDFEKLDVVTFSWQKALGGEAAHGMLILSPRAVERLESHTPPWPLPKILRLTSKGALNRAIFEGETINTPSMLCVEDYLVALEWAERIGGLKHLIDRADRNAGIIADWVSRTPWIEHLATAPETRSNTSVCLRLARQATAGLEDAALPKRMAKLLEAEGVAYDIASYRDAPPGFRIWCGATVEASDVEALIPWLEWAYARCAFEGALA